MAELERDPAISAIVLDSPLLYEAGLDELCDAVIFVDAAEGVRLERAQRQRGWSQEQLRRREELQMPVDTKRRRAEYIVDNNSELQPLRRTVEQIYHQIVGSSI